MLEETGPVDILVNNAGIPAEGIVVKSFVETGPADWDPLIRLNLAAVLGVTRAYLPAMLEQRWGRILTIVSDAGRRGRAQAGGLRRGEGGGDGLLAWPRGRGRARRRDRQLHLARHHAPRAAGRGDRARPGSRSRSWPRRIPPGRIGEVDDSAPLAVLLCSDAGVVDHRAGVPGRRRLCPRALSRRTLGAPGRAADRLRRPPSAGARLGLDRRGRRRRRHRRLRRARLHRGRPHRRLGPAALRPRPRRLGAERADRAHRRVRVRVGGATRRRGRGRRVRAARVLRSRARHAAARADGEPDPRARRRARPSRSVSTRRT